MFSTCSIIHVLFISPCCHQGEVFFILQIRKTLTRYTELVCLV